MEKIYILGAGGFAKEIFFLISQIGGYDVKAFVDIKPLPDIVIGSARIPVITEAELLQTEDVSVAIGVGDPKLIEKLAQKLTPHKFKFPNLVHPSVIGNFEDITQGRGNIITANCIFTTSIRMGSFNVFNLGCQIGHDVSIGDYNVMNPSVNVSGGVEIGNTNLLGVNATILQYKKIGNYSIVGASSLVTKNVGDEMTVVGVPAVKL